MEYKRAIELLCDFEMFIDELINDPVEELNDGKEGQRFGLVSPNVMVFRINGKFYDQYGNELNDEGLLKDFKGEDGKSVVDYDEQFSLAFANEFISNTYLNLDACKGLQAPWLLCVMLRRLYQYQQIAAWEDDGESFESRETIAKWIEEFDEPYGEAALDVMVFTWFVMCHVFGSSHNYDLFDISELTEKVIEAKTMEFSERYPDDVFEDLLSVHGIDGEEMLDVLASSQNQLIN